MIMETALFSFYAAVYIGHLGTGHSLVMFRKAAKTYTTKKEQFFLQKFSTCWKVRSMIMKTEVLSFFAAVHT